MSRLQPGQRVRLRDDGPVYTVTRVNDCAAYVRSERVRHVVLRDDDGEIRREFDARESGVVAIAPNASVIHEP